MMFWPILGCGFRVLLLVRCEMGQLTFAFRLRNAASDGLAVTECARRDIADWGVIDLCGAADSRWRTYELGGRGAVQTGFAA